MEKYGFFGGSFNPVTKAHVEIVETIRNKYGLDKVIFVPIGNKYNKVGLVNEIHRYNMLKIAICKYDNLEVSNIELNQEKNLTTLEAFNMIEEQYHNIEKFYIMGADNLSKMILSSDFEILAKNYKYIIIERNEIPCKELINSNPQLRKNEQNFMLMENMKYAETSATKAREELKKNNRINSIIDENVLDYIRINGLYCCDR